MPRVHECPKSEHEKKLVEAKSANNIGVKNIAWTLSSVDYKKFDLCQTITKMLCHFSFLFCHDCRK